MEKEDVVILTDQDEVPTRVSLRALAECNPPPFKAPRAGGSCAKPKVAFRTQSYIFNFDCATQEGETGLWWHPDAVPAECVMNGDWDLQEVRTKDGGSFMTEPWTGRHLHNFMTDKALVNKYQHYAHPCIMIEATCHLESWAELRWRTCDPKAPELGGSDWHTQWMPEEDWFLHHRVSPREVSAKSPHLPRMEAMRTEPELFAKFLWAGSNEIGNPWRNTTKGGKHTFARQGNDQTGAWALQLEDGSFKMPNPEKYYG